jgi:hypothetical protein
MIDCYELDDNIQYPCEPQIGGVSDRVYIFDKKHLDMPAILQAIDAENKLSLSDFQTLAGKTGFYIQGARNSVTPASTFSLIGKDSQCLHEVRFIIFKSDTKAKWQLSKMKKNKYVAIVENNDGTFEVYGLYNGLIIKEANYTPANPETKRTRAVLLANADDSQEPDDPHTLLATDYATTLALIESLIFVSANITPVSLPDVAVSGAYAEDLSVSGLSGTLTWSVVAGALPTGLSLNSSTGTISGTATTAGEYFFKIQVTNGTNTASETYSVTVTA